MSIKATREALLKTINFFNFYEGVGCKNDPTVTAEWVPCRSHRSFGGEDITPSASFNRLTGHYKDHRTGFSGTLFDFAAKVGLYPDWKTAVIELAKQYNIVPPTNDDLKPKLLEWNDCLADDFLRAKSPCTLEGLISSGAALYSFRSITCLGWGVYDKDKTVLGRHLLPRSGQTFSKNQKTHTVKKKDQENGLIGYRGMFLLHYEGTDPSNVWWTEGVSDLVALQGYLGPDGICVTNPNGCSEQVTQTQISCLPPERIKKIYVVADADAPGVKGAVNKATALVAAGLPAVPVVVPYDITPNHGKDIRDLLKDKLGVGADVPKEEALIQCLLPITPNVTEKVEIEAKRDKEEQVLQLMQHLGLHILGKTGGGGTIILYCSHTGQSCHFSLRMGCYAEMLAVAGPKFATFVTNERTRVNGLYTMDDFRNALAIYSSNETPKQKRLLGAGVWKKDDNTLLLVSNQQCFTVSEGRIGGASPIQGNLIADLNCDLDWLEPERLVVELALAQDPVYRIERFHRVVNIVNTWPWAEPYMGELAVGLLCATMIQDLWDWRPSVVVTGESATGKTSLFKLFRKLCLGLAIETANTTVAGIIQSTQGNSSPLFIDEIDQRNTKEQQELLKMLRLASQGQSIRRGTAGQVGKVYHVKHLAWLAGISTASTAQADLNRQIDLPLVRRENGRFATPTDREIERMGWDLFGSVLVVAHKAIELARALQLPPDGVGGEVARLWEARVVPCAMRAAVHDMGIDEARTYTESVVLPLLTADITGAIREAADHRAVFEAIMTKPVIYHAGGMGNRDTIVNLIFEKTIPLDTQKVFEHLGVRFVINRVDEPYVAIDCARVVSQDGLLGRTEPWSTHGGVKTLLMRFTEMQPIKRSCRINGTHVDAVTFTIANLKAHYKLDEKETI